MLFGGSVIMGSWIGGEVDKAVVRRISVEDLC